MIDVTELRWLRTMTHNYEAATDISKKRYCSNQVPIGTFETYLKNELKFSHSVNLLLSLFDWCHSVSTLCY